MSLSTQLIADLAAGVAYPFTDWPNSAVPTFGVGIYRHNDGRFIYVGMSGRGITTDTVHRNTPQGIYTRLQSHAMLPTLSSEDIAAIASGRDQMDAFVRRYIHENLSYRFIMAPDGPAAYAVETTIKSGEWEHGRPLLNPGG